MAKQKASIDIEKIKQIAEKTRKWAEKQRQILNNKGKHYNDNMMCLCVISSYKLWKNLNRNNIQAKLVWNHGHCFVMINDLKIDITATQFGNWLPVTIIKPDQQDYHTQYFWKKETTITTRSKNKTIKRKLKAWPQNQNPFTYLTGVRNGSA